MFLKRKQKMNEPQRKFLNKLLSIEAQNQEYKLKYEREVKIMLDEKLNLLTRIVFVLLALFGLFLSIFYGGYFFKNYGSDEIAFVVKLSVLPAIFLFFVLSALTGWAAIKGKTSITLKSNMQYLATIFGIVLGFAIVTQLMFMFVIPLTIESPVNWRSILGTQLVFTLFFFLIIVVLCVILKKIYSSEVKTREKLLEIEYRIADIAEKLEKTKTNE
jgi:hypothetical protein